MNEKLKLIKEEKPWYAEGLHFKCTECGKCCTGAPGYVWVNEQEIIQIAAHLQLSLAEFSNRYLRKINGRISLKEEIKTFDCIFLKDKKCQIYSCRPTQCRTFPWWPLNLKSKKEWENAASYCEGIHANAPLVEFDQIEQQRLLQEKQSNLSLTPASD